MALETLSMTFPPLFADLPDVFAERFDPEAPWALLGDPLDEVLDALPSSDIRIRLSDGQTVNVQIHRGTKIVTLAVKLGSQPSSPQG